MAVIVDEVGADETRADQVEADEVRADEAATRRTEAQRAAGDGAKGGASTEKTPLLRRGVTISVLLGAVAVLIGLAAWKGVQLHTANERAARDGTIVSTTKDVVAGLVSLDYTRTDKDLARVRESSTGAFLGQFNQMADSFQQVLGQGKVKSTGVVKEAGIVSADDDSATVLAAVTSTVSNTEAKDGQQRVYRMRVHLTLDGDKWLVENVEFVDE